MKIVVGVDGGGSKTEAVVGHVNSGLDLRVLGRGLGGPSNLSTNNPTQVSLSIQNAIFEALNNNPMELKPVAICIGLAGASDGNLPEEIRLNLKNAYPNQKFIFTSDLESILSFGNSDNENRIGLISGTGSIAFTKTADSQILRSGGWGYLMDDPGSGYWIGKQLLSLYFQAIDTTVRSDEEENLIRQLHKSFQFSSAMELKNWLYQSTDSSPNTKIASLTEWGFDNLEGQVGFVDILKEGARELFKLTKNVLQKTIFGQSRNYELLVGGSLLTKRPSYLNLLSKEFEKSDLRPESVVSVDCPAIGALRIAAKKSSI